MPQLESWIGQPVQKTCSIRGKEADGRKAIVRRGRLKTRIAEFSSDGLMMDLSEKVDTSLVYDVQQFVREEKPSNGRIPGFIGKRGTTTLPLEFRRRLGLHPNDAVLFEARDGTIVIYPAKIDLRDARPREDLESLIARITPENIHTEVDFGPPVGRELL